MKDPGNEFESLAHFEIIINFAFYVLHFFSQCQPRDKTSLLFQVNADTVSGSEFG